MKLKHLFENEVPKITNPYEAYKYAERQGKRVPELEPTIMKNSYWAILYAREIIKGRWPEAEPYLFKHSTSANKYLRDIPEARNPSKSVPLVLGKYAITDVPNTITDEQVIKLIKLIIAPEASVQNVNFGRIYFEPEIKQKLENNKLKQVITKQLMNDKRIRTQFLKNFNCNISGDFQ